MSVTFPAPQSASASLAVPLVEEATERSRHAHVDFVPSVLVSGGGKKRRTGGRVLSQEDTGGDGESYTYTAKTQFHVCASPGVSLEEEALRASLVEVLALDEAQVCAPEFVRTVLRKRIVFCFSGTTAE